MECCVETTTVSPENTILIKLDIMVHIPLEYLLANLLQEVVISRFNFARHVFELMRDVSIFGDISREVMLHKYYPREVNYVFTIQMIKKGSTKVRIYNDFMTVSEIVQSIQSYNTRLPDTV